MFGRSIAAVLAALACAASAAAEEAKYDTEADWAKRPTPEELMSVWPAEAMKSGATGNARITCKVNVRGVLFNCVVESESPPGGGFGAAAMALTPQLLMKPATKDGVAVESEVTIPITFKWPESKSFLKDPAAPPDGRESLRGMREIVINPAWLDAPTLTDVALAYPEKARTARASGQVTLACVVTAQGGLDPCSPILEEPRGLGFGKAARQLAVRFKMSEAMADGASAKGAAVNIVFSFTPEVLDGKYPPSRQYWVEKPSPADLAARLPDAVRKADAKAAQAELVCRVGPQGRLSECVASNETPAAMGLDEAALALAPKYRVSPWSSDGVPIVGIKVRVPVEFIPKPAAPGS